jgi:hypothetical protein
MNIGQLRRVLADLPRDMPVVIDDCQMGWMTNTALYLAPAHVDYTVAGTDVSRHHQDGADNCHALLITSLGQTDAGTVDITPHAPWRHVIDVDLDDPNSPEPGMRQLDARPALEPFDYDIDPGSGARAM